MSRRRAAEETTIVVDESATLPKLDAKPGKQRTLAERIGRFFRNRPVSSVLLVIAFLALAVTTYSLGRVVGQTIIHFFFPSGLNVTSRSPAQKTKKQHLTNTSLIVGADNNAANGDAHYKDERGTIVDSANSHKREVRSNNSPSPVHQCFRKFEPGKLGWSKTLCVTDEFFFDISIGTTAIGRFKIGVFGDVVPKSAANFRALVTCTGVFSDQALCYRNDAFHRIVSNFVLQGGSKATGRSIYGSTFLEEQSKDHHSFLSHIEKGVVSWAEYPIGSQFYILYREEAKYLDKNHVVFGIVTDGMEVIAKMHDAPRTGEEPAQKVKITACGDAHQHR